MKNFFKEKIITIKTFFNRINIFTKTLGEYDRIAFEKNILQIKLFKKDKLICESEYDLYIFNLLTKKIILKKRIGYWYDIKIFKKNKFFLCDYTSEIYNIKLFEFIENKKRNEYYLKKLNEIPQKSNNLFLNKNSIIVFKKDFCFIYNFLENKRFELETKISLPDNGLCYSGISQNSKIYITGLVKRKLFFWNLKKYQFKLISVFNTDDEILVNVILSKNNVILISEINYIKYIYLLSYEDLKIKVKIKCISPIRDITVTENEEIYLYEENIYKLDFKNESIYDISSIRKNNNKEILSISIIENGKRKIVISSIEGFGLTFNDFSTFYLFKQLIIFFLLSILYLNLSNFIILGKWKIIISLNFLKISLFFSFFWQVFYAYFNIYDYYLSIFFNILLIIIIAKLRVLFTSNFIWKLNPLNIIISGISYLKRNNFSFSILLGIHSYEKFTKVIISSLLLVIFELIIVFQFNN